MPSKPGSHQRQDLVARLEEGMRSFDPKRFNAKHLRLERLPPGEQPLMMQFRDVPREDVISILLLAAQDGHHAAQRMVYALQHVPRTLQKSVSWDMLAQAAGIRPSEFVGLVAQVGAEYEIDMNKLLMRTVQRKAITTLEKSVTQTTGAGKEIAARERDKVLQAAGVFPIPRQAHVHMHAPPAAAPPTPEGRPVPIGRTPPSFRDDMEVVRLAQDTMRRRLLGDGALEGEVVRETEDVQPRRHRPDAGGDESGAR